jgi:type II secretory pathway component GspD/PulD (secretin)
LVVGAFYQKEIRVAYHRNRMWAAAENYALLAWKPERTMVSKLDGLRILLFKMSEGSEQEAMFQHQEALLEFGYFEKREFWLTNHFTSRSNISPPLRQQVTNTFDSSHWCTYSFPETNKFVVTATPADMPKWEKLISDFDK